jgi:hypothetical protein
MLQSHFPHIHPRDRPSRKLAAMVHHLLESFRWRDGNLTFDDLMLSVKPIGMAPETWVKNSRRSL